MLSGMLSRTAHLARNKRLHLRRLQRLVPFLPHDISLRQLASTLVRHTDYCCIGHCLAAQQQRLEFRRRDLEAFDLGED